ncbi:ATP-binding protein, partial [Streptomyces sp. NPDC056982]|uniref:ATP-binding protein n=1 Tax=Streptomyces sp. NPDC056982 TaxID=3345986 RepID=UPI00363FFA12
KMNKVKSVKINTHLSNNLDLELISEEYDEKKPFYTVITGRNGSYKSTVLKEIAGYAMLGENELSDSQSVDFHIEDLSRFKVIAHSGATIDRYPLKKNNGKSVSNFNHYTYLGQKAGTNIVSRRQPYETMLSEALTEEKTTRIHSSHFNKCFQRLNLYPGIKFTLILMPLKSRLFEYSSLYEWVYAASQNSGNEHRRSRLVDSELAKYLLYNFTKDDFNELQNIRGQRKIIDFSEEGIYNLKSGDKKIIRLGLMLDVLKVQHAEIYSLYTKEGFSLYDLSTGEFNNLTSILGILFAVEKHSIVLVDEPEVSLHPQWQVEFIEIISDIFKDYEVSHVIISTHSPMIVSSVAA